MQRDNNEMGLRMEDKQIQDRFGSETYYRSNTKSSVKQPYKTQQFVSPTIPIFHSHEFILNESDDQLEILSRLTKQIEIKTQALNKAEQIIAIQQKQIEQITLNLKEREEKIQSLEEQKKKLQAYSEKRISLGKKQFEENKNSYQPYLQKLYQHSEPKKHITKMNSPSVPPVTVFQELSWELVKQKLWDFNQEVQEINNSIENEASTLQQALMEHKHLKNYFHEEVLPCFRVENRSNQLISVIGQYENLVKQYQNYTTKLKSYLSECVQLLQEFYWCGKGEKNINLHNIVPQQLFRVVVREVTGRWKLQRKYWKHQNGELSDITQKLISKLKNSKNVPKTARY